MSRKLQVRGRRRSRNTVLSAESQQRRAASPSNLAPAHVQNSAENEQKYSRYGGGYVEFGRFEGA